MGLRVRETVRSAWYRSDMVDKYLGVRNSIHNGDVAGEDETRHNSGGEKEKETMMVVG